MAKDDLVHVPGKVIESKGNGQYKVALDNGVEAMAQISGRLRKFKVRVLVGDKVTVSFSPYDVSKGLITQRERLS